MKKLVTFTLGLLIVWFVLIVVAAVWLWRVIGKDIFKFVYETGETAYNYLKARYERKEQAEPEESETTEDE